MIKHILLATIALSIYDAGPAYPGQWVIEGCNEEQPPRCVSIRVKDDQISTAAGLDAVADQLRNQLELQAK